MLGLILQYFYPLVREDNRWAVSRELMDNHVEKYLARCAIPTFLFWGLDLYFLTTNPMLAAVCLSITLPFAWTFGLLLREYLEYRKSHRH
ncbi:MAG: hypothetical protein AB1810_14365 [Pseudomonadota bacterium]